MKRLPDALDSAVHDFRARWQSAVDGPRRRLALAVGLAAVTTALGVARGGTVRTRLAATVLMLGAACMLLVARWLERRIMRDPARTIYHVARRVDPELARRAVRALSLRSEHAAGTSEELVQLHVKRALGAISLERVSRVASRYAARLTYAAAALFVVVSAAWLTNFWLLFEGFDVLLARDGTAPFEVVWLSDVEMRARPPEYLHQEESALNADDEASLPRGAWVSVRGVPVHPGRALFLQGGSVEVPFSDDGNGHMVARWRLGDTVNLRVVARFGTVVLPASTSVSLVSVADRAPDVVLEGAPKRVVLGGQDPAAPSEIPIRYEATDDHGLTEVHLVLRSCGREERRVLSQLDSETKHDRGGSTLRLNDAFLKKCHAPLEVRVEAKDNDAVMGPKWGTSEAFVVVPPDVGAPEAQRLAALGELRDAMVDALAWRLAQAIPREPAALRDFLDHEARLEADIKTRVDAALSALYSGLRIPGRLALIMRGRLRAVNEAVANEARAPSTKAHAVVTQKTERLVLVVDAMMRGQGLRDSRGVARDLANVADDLAAEGTRAITAVPDEKIRSAARIDAASQVLEGGSRSLLRLGALGRDLGEIVAMDLARMARTRALKAAAAAAAGAAAGHGDLPHFVLAAQDLAARLHLPDPSFGASGGRPSSAGGESGGSRGAPSEGDDDQGSENHDIEQAFNEAVQDLDKLIAEHAALVDSADRARSGAGRNPELRATAEAERKLADRAHETAQKGRKSEGVPEAALDALDRAAQAARDAANAFDQDHKERALERQREAQKQLEASKSALGENEPQGEGESAASANREGNERSGSSSSSSAREHAEIPRTENHRESEEFRRRVMKGLGQPTSGKWREAVKRYAEGLVR